MRPHRIFAIVVSVLSFSSALHATQASCTFDTFSVPSQYTLNAVEGIGDDGTVVGQVVDNKTQVLMGFMRSSAGDLTVYSAPKSTTTWINGENATGTSTGYYLDSGLKVHGFTLVNGTFTEIDYPKAANTWLFDVNHVGALVGGFGGAGIVKGFVLANGEYTTLVNPGEQITYATAVNDNNAVVGYSLNGWVSYGFLWENGKFTAINSKKAKYGTSLSGINNSGVIVGNYVYADHDGGFLYENGAFKGVVYPGAKYTVAGGINNNGVVSGLIVESASTLGFTATCK